MASSHRFKLFLGRGSFGNTVLWRPAEHQPTERASWVGRWSLRGNPGPIALLAPKLPAGASASRNWRSAVEPLAWLLLLMAVAIVAAYFYLKRRQQQINTSSARDDEVRASTYTPPPPTEDVEPPHEDRLP